MKLNQSNYYTTNANRAYMSASLVKSMLTCEAQAMAELRGEWSRPRSNALLIGSYVDAAIDSDMALHEFREHNPEIFKRDGTLKAEFVQAEKMVDRAMRDPVFYGFTIGVRQKIFTGEIGGVPFKAKFDFYVPDERIVDLKTVRSFEPVYMEGQGRVSFAEAWRWPLQMAIYQKLEGHRLPCFLAVITKEDPPDIDVVEIPQSVLDTEMDLLLEKLPRLEAVWSGAIEPERCEKCAYCRETKELTGPRSILEYEFAD